jgi:hypothetical protein
MKLGFGRLFMAFASFKSGVNQKVAISAPSVKHPVCQNPLCSVNG